MSFGGFGGGGGFGQQQQNQSSTGFGGFGSNNNATPAFGSSTTPAFGGTSANTGGGLFGGSPGAGAFGNNTGGAFGSTSNNSLTSNNAFGAKPAFGAPAATTSSGGGLFGSTTATTGGGAFGTAGGFGSNNTTATTSAFGSGGGMFGSASKPALTGTGGMFGGSGGGFGTQNNTPSAFGTAAAPAIGAAPEPPGTNIAPFNPLMEKEQNSSTQNSFQNILFQDPYKRFSAEELRMADYSQGRQYGNGPAGAAGAFGATSSGFGGTGFGNNTNTGFSTGGNTGGGLFGGQNNASTGFGATSNTTNNAFGGASAGGGLFGAKPAATGNSLFGSTPASQPAQTNSLFSNNTTGFGNNSTPSTGFGATPAANTGGGLFGAQAQNKPATGFGGTGFGNTTTPSNTFGGGSTGFGANNNTPNTGGGLFGGAQNQASNTGTGGLFGQNNQQQQPAQNSFGATNTGFGGAQPQQQGSSLFGGQQKPASGLFGNAGAAQPAAGGGLFGSQPSTNNAFGQTNNQQQQQGGLFGAQKPAGGGLFGTAGTQQTGQTAGGGLFGNLGGGAQPQQQQNSLFGNQNQQKPSLFGSAPSTTGTGLFGQPPQQQNNGMFGGSSAQQPQQGSLLGNSLFNTSQNAQSTPQSLTASISDVNAYGTPSLFAGLGTTEVQNPGPLATPLSSKNKPPRKNSILPMWKLNPGSGSKFVTPVKRGFGFSYSTYGSPVTPSTNNSTPGNFGQSLLGSNNLNRSLSKSYSSSNLRRSINAEDSILSPGSFSASMGTRAYGSPRFNKLTVDKSLRVDLFSPLSKDKQAFDSPLGPRKLTKRVSFEPNVESQNRSPVTAGSSETPTGSSPDNGYIPKHNGGPAHVNGTNSRGPEMEQVQSTELAVVQEESSPASASASSAAPGAHGKGPGNYWMEPSKEEILKMNRVQMQQVADLTVGRDNVGQVRFLTPVDLTNINVDDIPGRIVVLETRSCTVYPENMKKPPMGKGLNVPSEISLLHSWPRHVDKKTGLPVKSGRALEKHISKLKNIPDAAFISYDPETGVWTFTVEHFTTYGLDYDEDTDGETLGDITMDEDQPPPQTKPAQPQEKDDTSPAEPEEDTFNFRRKRRALPGAFDYTGPASDDEDGMADANEESFLSERSAGSTSQALMLNEADGMDVEHALPEDQDASAYLGYHQAAEPETDSPYYGSMAEYQETPGGIMRARMQAIRGANSPLKIQVADGDDWMDMLQKTISPLKRDRAALKTINEEQTYEALKESVRKEGPPASKVVSDGRGFATSIDLMNSLFDKPKASVRPAMQATIPTSGFKMPHKIHHKPSDEEEEMDANDRGFHDSLRPSWGPDGTLVISTAPKVLSRSSKRAIEKDGIMSMSRLNIVSENRDIRFARFANESSAAALANQISLSNIVVVDNIPTVELGPIASLTALFHGQDLQSPSNAHEKMVWDLASILFDHVTDAQGGTIAPSRVRQARRRNLSNFWQGIVEEASNRGVGMVRRPEDKAIAALSGHRIPEACKHLLDGKIFRLATLVSLIGTSDRLMQEMRDQVREWRDANVLSEFADPIRAIYELLGGNVCTVDGKKGAMENRMDSFVISDKFGMDWKQAFGLRLWYAITSNDDVVEAIHAYKEDLGQDREKQPKPWYAEQGIQTLWDDPDKEEREDLLWGLLKLYADQATDLADVLRPENSQLSPLDYRLCWQLGQALTNTGRVKFGEDAADKADAATLSFASQLTSEGNWLEAVFVLLHLSDPTARAKAIQEHLSRHGRLIGSEQGEDFVLLTQTFKIPATWIWQAKALFMRAVKKDPQSEVLFLLRAESYAEAHRTFTKQVAPRAVIERDYEALWETLNEFRGAEDAIPDWNLGGKIYADFLDLVQHVRRGKAAECPQVTVKSLMAGLPALRENVQVRGDADVLAVAAVADMANVTAKVVVELAKNGETQLSRVLGLPLTEDAYLKYSNELAFAYYRDVMVGR